MKTRKQQQLLIAGAVVVVAIVAAVVLIMNSGNISASSVDYSTVPHSRLPDGGFVLGNPDAPITVVEFADFGCPHCQDYKSTVDRFIQDFVLTGKAKFEFRIMPTAGGALTDFAGRVAECVEELQPGSFWKQYELFYVYARSGRYTDQMGRLVAEELGVPYSEVLDCTRTADQVRTDQALASRLGVTGTPAVMVRYGDSEPTFINFGGQTYNRGPVTYDVLAQVIAAAQT